MAPNPQMAPIDGPVSFALGGGRRPAKMNSPARGYEPTFVSPPRLSQVPNGSKRSNRPKPLDDYLALRQILNHEPATMATDVIPES